MGLFNLQVGNPGQVLSGVFAEIPWGVNDYFLKVEIDENGGSDYELLGVSQLLSVPYSLWSENTAHPEDADADPINELQTVDEQNYDVTLSQGGGSFMTGVKSYTQAEIDAMMPYNGVHNSTTNCINYYNLNNWFEACGICTPMPGVAYAGNDTIVDGGDTTLILAAITPEIGNGLWSVLSGEGGIFTDPASPTTLFTGLPEITYTLQWEIYTECDTTYDGVTIKFWQCSLPITDNRNSQSYETVRIGEQCWMAENLNIGTMINGSGNQTDNEEIEKYCYNNTASNCDAYGGLYQWDEMMKYTTTQGAQGICMEGWHVPTDAEWCILEQEVDPTIICSITGWRGVDGGTKIKHGGSSGFEALLAGYRGPNGSFDNLGSAAALWSSSESGADAWSRYLSVSVATVNRGHHAKDYGFSVRCLKDN